MATGGTPLDLWRRDQLRRGLAPRTIAQRVRTARAFRRWLGRPLTTATDEDIQSWLDTCRLGPSGRYTYLKDLQSFYVFARRHRLIQRNPVAQIAKPKVRPGLPHPIADNDLAYAMSQADARTRCWLALAAYAGCRCAEIAGLRVEDLLLDRPDPLVVLTTTKGDRPRVLPLNPIVEHALREYGLPRTGYVFARRDTGTALKPQTISAYLSRFLHGLGINASAHSGRHAFGTAVYQRTKDLRLTQELLGHANPATTAIYTKFDPAGAEVVRRLGVDNPSEESHSVKPWQSTS